MQVLPVDEDKKKDNFKHNTAYPSDTILNYPIDLRCSALRVRKDSLERSDLFGSYRIRVESNPK